MTRPGIEPWSSGPVVEFSPLDWQIKVQNIWVKLEGKESVKELHPLYQTNCKYEGVSVMIQGAFANCKIGYFHQEKSKLNQTGYHSILQHHVIPSGMRLIGQGFVFKQDNNLKQTSKICQRYVKSQDKLHIPQLMSWLGQSADLNPIGVGWTWAKSQNKPTHKCSDLARTIFSLPPVFGRKNAVNLWSSDSDQRGSFWWIRSFKIFRFFFWFNLYLMWKTCI